MAWAVRKSSVDVKSVRSTLEEFEDQADVEQIDNFGLETTGPNRILIEIEYTEAA